VYRICVYLAIPILFFTACHYRGKALEGIETTVTSADAPEEKPLSDDSNKREKLLFMIYNMEKYYSLVTDYSAIFIKQERIKGKLLKKETIKVYFKKPFNLYMEWIKEPHKGRQAIFRRGYNDDKMLVRFRVLWQNRTFAVEPTSKLAMMNNRHPITEMGLGFLIAMLVKNAKIAKKNRELKLVYHGEEQICGRAVYKIEGILPKDKSKGYYCYRAILGIDKQNGLPILVEAYMWDNLLYERYLYSELNLNAGVEEYIFKLPE